jgi:hypothetical protein
MPTDCRPASSAPPVRSGDGQHRLPGVATGFTGGRTFLVAAGIRF